MRYSNPQEMFPDSTSRCAALDAPLDVDHDHMAIFTVSGSDYPTPIDTQSPPKDKEPVTEAYYYQKLRESADRFAHQLSTS